MEEANREIDAEKKKASAEIAGLQVTQKKCGKWHGLTLIDCYSVR